MHAALEAGVDDFIKKPLDEAELTARTRAAQSALGKPGQPGQGAGVLPHRGGGGGAAFLARAGPEPEPEGRLREDPPPERGAGEGQHGAGADRRLRQPLGAAQPPEPFHAHLHRDRAQHPPGRAPHRAHDRHRQVQEHQRQLRPPVRRHGHPRDRRAAAGGLRKYDYAGRYGGEEFFVVLSNSTEKQALRHRRALPQGHGGPAGSSAAGRPSTSPSPSAWPATGRARARSPGSSAWTAPCTRPSRRAATGSSWTDPAAAARLRGAAGSPSAASAPQSFTIPHCLMSSQTARAIAVQLARPGGELPAGHRTSTS